MLRTPKYTSEARRDAPIRGSSSFVADGNLVLSQRLPRPLRTHCKSYSEPQAHSASCSLLRLSAYVRSHMGSLIPCDARGSQPGLSAAVAGRRSSPSTRTQTCCLQSPELGMVEWMCNTRLLCNTCNT